MDQKFKSFIEKLEKRETRKNVAGALKFFVRKNGEYHTVHGVDASYIAEEFFKTREVIKELGDGVKIPTVNVNHKMMARVIKEAVLKEYRDVEVYVKEENEWKLKKKASPGNLQGFEDILFFEGDGVANSSATMAVRISARKEGQLKMGMAIVDTDSQTLRTAELLEHEKLWNLESAIIQYGIKECFIDIDKAAQVAVKEQALSVFTRCKVQYEECKTAFFKTENIRQDVQRLVGAISPHLEKLDKTLAMGSLACLILKLDLLKDDSKQHKFTLEDINLNHYVRLDAAAIKALNIEPQPTDSDKSMSLYGLLNKCRTQMGGRLLRRWLLQPLRDISAIEKRLDMVDCFVEAQDIRASLQEQELKGVPDLDRITKGLKKRTAALKDLYQLWIFASKLPAVVERLQEYEGDYSEKLSTTFIEPLSQLVSGFSQYVALVEKLLDFQAIEEERAYRINPDFDPVLGEYKKTIRSLTRKMENMREHCASDLGLDDKKVKLAQLTTKRWHFRITRKDEKNLRKKSSYTTLETRKDGVKFTNRKLTELSEEYIETERLYTEQQRKIVDKGMEVAETYLPVIKKAIEIVARLDVFVSFAHVAVNAAEPYCRPKILPATAGRIEMKRCRHPCIEAQDFVDFIANDVNMVRGESNCQIITGPNMGGKSTYIRQVGVSVLLAQIGCFVPCDSAKISIVDCILARVGAGDSQLKGVSTFMKEMLEAAAIIRSASENSLIIVDELGRGTSTYDGFGLAWAIAEHLAKSKRAYTLFATHFHELTKLAENVRCVVNRHVTAHTDNNSITMLYQLNSGPCDRSFGIHVAELAKFPKEVVASAKRKAEELEDFGGAAEKLLSSNINSSGDASKMGKKQRTIPAARLGD